MSKASKDKSSGAKPDPLGQAIVERWAQKHRVEFPTAEKVLWLTRVLRHISASPLGGDFALMGGSAIVFLYRDMYRFSTDLDLDFVGNRNLGRKGMREVDERKEKDVAVLEDIARQLGLKFKRRPKPQDRFVQYELIYPSVYTRTGNVELDISYRYGHSVLGTVSRPWPIEQGASLPAFSVNTLKEEEVYASKAIAMVDVKERLDFPTEIGLFTKRKIRHLFDVYLLARDVLDGKSNLNLGQFRDLFVLFGMTRIKNFEYFRGNAIGSYKDADIKAELLSVVPRDFPVPTVDEMKWTVRKFLDQHVFTYSEREYRFMEDFRSGHFRPEDLFGSGTLPSRLRDTQYYREILGKVAQLQKRGGSRGKRASGKSLP
jgi:hypothetical protein